MSDATAAAEKEGAAPAKDAAAPAKGGSKKLLVIIAAAVVALGAAGGGAFFFMSKGKAAEESAEHDAEEDAAGDAAEGEEKESKPKEKTKSKAKGKKGKKGKEAAPKGPAIYVEFEPPFVVNFEAKGVMRFLQVSVEVMTRDQATADMVKAHDPKLRNDLLLLFGSQTYDTISTLEGKERLRAEALQAVAKVIADEGGAGDKVEQMYFTSFVMQ